MESMLGIRFLASEYPTGPWHRGRIDTLGLDENNVPVLVEYKKGSDSGLLTELLAEFSQVSDLVAETSLSRPWRHLETWRACPSPWSGNWWPWMIRGSPTGSSTRPENRSRELAPSYGTCREPAVRQRRPVPTGWTCCAGSASFGLSRCRGTERAGSRRGTSPAGFRSPGSRDVRTGDARAKRAGGPQGASRTHRRCERTARQCCGVSTTSTRHWHRAGPQPVPAGPSTSRPAGSRPSQPDGPGP